MRVELNSVLRNLIAVDANQNNVKKLKAAATITRDDAAGKLKDKMFRVRNFAKACFANNAEVMVQLIPTPN